MPQIFTISDEEEEEENLDDQDERGNLKDFINDDDDEEGINLRVECGGYGRIWRQWSWKDAEELKKRKLMTFKRRC